jgi:hypothetical protein
MGSSQTEGSSYGEAFEENLRRISKASSDLYHLLCMGTWRSAGCRVEAGAGAWPSSVRAVELDDHQVRIEKRPRLSHDHGEAGAFDSLIRALGPRPERAFADVV